ncbi:MAG: protein kinase [Candidatus Eremiobacteraeota bacterium]|nr:protein kinase [Candidatus Eremiobacteraeota bacterium]MCW5868101.1 protein kinase [Candidatus Eremiobacteraeota bacterium]
MSSSGIDGAPIQDGLQLGQVLDHRYDVKELVGRGGMGTVYRVRDWDWNVDLAVKVPARHLISDWVAKERFLLEAQTWIELGVHPHIVQCWFVREYEGSPLVFMDYLPAGSLKEWREQGKIAPGDWEVILDLMIQATAGLGYAHEQGLVHRDVKPANLLMREDGRLCVTDFGLVKVTDLSSSAPSAAELEKILADLEARGLDEESLTLTRTGTLLGTPEYGAPEQWMAAGNVGIQADIYALGIILYELCAGRRPFDDGVKKVSAAIMLGEHLMTPAPDPRQFRPEIPERLAALCLRCLAKDPLQRPASMQELREELAALYQDCGGRPYPRPAPRAGTQRADALNNKAVSFWNLGFGQRAFDAWREAAKLDGLHPETVYNKTLVQWRLAQIDDAEVMQRLTQVKTTYPHLGTYLGYFLLEQGDAQTAEQEIRQALVNPLAARQGTAWRALGDARMYLEQYTPAAEAYQQALRRMPDDRQASARLEMARQNQRQLDRVLFPRTTPRLVLEKRSAVAAVALSPEGDQAAHWADDTLELWNTQDGSLLWSWRAESGAAAPGRLVIERGWVLSLASAHGRCWSRSTGQLLFEVEGRKRILAVHSRLGWGLVGGEVLEQVKLPGGDVLQALEGHGKPITTAALSADGKLAATGGGDRSVRLWDLEAGRCLHLLEGHTDLVESVVLSSDCSLAFSGSRDKTVRIWQVSTGDCLYVLQHAHEVRRIRLTADGHHLLVANWALGEKDQLDVWEVATGQRLFTRPGGHWLCPFSTGPWALVASKTARPAPLTLWEIPSGRQLCAFSESPGEITGLALSRDNRWALSGGNDGSLRLWEVDWAARVGEFSLVVNRTFDHDQVESTQQLFLKHLDTAERQWEARETAAACAQLREARNLAGYARDPGALALNARMLERLSRQGIQAVWQLRSFASNGSVAALKMSADGQLALSASGKFLYLWELSSGSCLRGFTGHTDQVTAVALSRETALSASLDGTVRLWSLASGECLEVYRMHEPVLHLGVSNSSLFLVSSPDKLIVARVARPDPLLTVPINEPVCLALSRDGRLAVSGSEEPESLRLWRLPAATFTRPWRAPRTQPGALGPGSATALALSGEGRFVLAGDAQGWLRLLDVEEGWCRSAWQAHHQAVRSVRLSSDGRVAFSSAQDGTVSCWDVVSGRRWETWPGPYEAMSITPEGRFLLTAGADRVLRLWELDWELNAQKEVSGLADAWKKSTVLEMISGLFKRKT